MFKTFTSKAKLAVLASAVAAGNAMAALPASVQTDLDAVKSDVGTIGAAVLLVVIAILAFKMLRKGAN
jgi:cytochrome c556